MLSRHSLILIVAVTLAFSSITLNLIVNPVLAQNSNECITLTVTADRGRYTLDEDVKIWGIIYDQECNPTVARVTIQITKDNRTLYSVSKVTAPENGSYFDNGYNVQETGLHDIIVTAYNAGYSVNASTSFMSVYSRDVTDLLEKYSPEVVVILAALVYFFIVVAIKSKSIAKEKSDLTPDQSILVERHKDQIKSDFSETTEGKQEASPQEKKHTRLQRPIIWLERRNIAFKNTIDSLKILFKGLFLIATVFLILTTFTAVTVVTLLFMPSPIGETSPIGLVINTDVSNQTQWVINIGGQPIGEKLQYVGGIQIPIYVIVLSFLGAYIFFLTQTPILLKKLKTELIDESLLYLMRFFMAPILAIALYLVLWQLEVRGTFILAAISFATGLISEQVTKRIVEFAKDAIGKKNETDTNKQDQTTKP